MEIGDKVKVIDHGEVYSTYTEMFEKMSFKNKKNNYFKDEHENKTFKVFAKEKHLKNDETLYGIRRGKSELLTNANGLKLQTKTKKEKIKTALNILNKEFDASMFSIEIFNDGSGNIKKGDNIDTFTIDFTNKKEMKTIIKLINKNK